MPSQQTIRRYILTGAVTAITVTGAIYGAGLKTQQQADQARRKPQEFSSEEKIQQLEEARARLVAQRVELERKADAFKMGKP